jgi:hypothetical protein
MPHMSAAADPGEPSSAPISGAAELARQRLHEEIERVRVGVEEMLSEQQGSPDPDLRRELDALRQETRRYVKRRVRKSEKRLEKRIGKVGDRTEELERRLDRVEEDRRYAEWRIHTNTEQMLDGLLREIRAIADLLTRTR